MKLYVWNQPYSVSWGGSCLYVLAASLPSARKAARKAIVAAYGGVYDGSTVTSLDKLGEPDRIESGPYAEVYEWSE
jgi:hypothetical protein